MEKEKTGWITVIIFEDGGHVCYGPFETEDDALNEGYECESGTEFYIINLSEMEIFTV